VVPQVDTDDLIDAQEVAEILGLSQRNSVSLYQRRYPDMPRPVVERGGARTKLWLRSDMERWRNERRIASTDAS
jgi:glutathione-regulated potassium-efflux system ancillary protein KefG